MSLKLSDLPIEVLNTIFSYNLLTCTYIHYADQIKTSVWTKQPDLHALCLTNRRISGIAQRILLGDVAFSLCDNHSIMPAADDESCSCDAGIRDRASLFFRSHPDNSSSWHRIRRLKMSVNKNFTSWHGYESDESLSILETHVRCLLSALSLSSSLNSLEFNWAGLSVDSPCLGLTGFPPDCFGALKSLEIHMPLPDSIPPDIFLRWCELPQLRILTVGVRVRGYRTGVSTGPYKIESLRVVNLCCCAAYSDLLRSVIPELQFLTTLDLPMLGCIRKLRAVQDRWDRWDEWDEWNVTFEQDEGMFSPREIGSCLAPMIYSLRHLSIVSAEQMVFQSHDGSVLDLSEFRHLQKVKLSAYFFGGISTATGIFDCCRENLVELLPASLQELEIILNGIHGLFYGFSQLECIRAQWAIFMAPNEAEESFRLFWYDEMKSHAFVLQRLRWITDLLTAQPIQLPELTRFLVSEGMSPRPFTYINLADQLPLLVEGSGVNVQILQKVAGNCRVSDLPEDQPIHIACDTPDEVIDPTID